MLIFPFFASCKNGECFATEEDLYLLHLTFASLFAEGFQIATDMIFNRETFHKSHRVKTLNV